MDDLRLLSAFGAGPDGGPSFAEELLRSSLDLTSTHTHEGMLVALRWHFLLGSLPITFTSTSEMRSKCAASWEWMTQDWDAACAKRGSAVRSVKGADSGGSEGQLHRSPPKRRLARFDSSSSSASSDDDTERVARGPSGRAAASSVQSDPSVKSSTTSRAENPLRPSSESVYALQFHVEQVRKEIQRDMDRLFWELPLFQIVKTKRDITDILINYCISEGRMYKQGLHEVAAFLYYVVHRDRTILAADDKELEATTAANGGATSRDTEALRAFVDLYRSVSSPAAQLTCTYALFKRVMAIEEVQEGAPVEDSSSSGGFGLSRWYYSPADFQSKNTGGTASEQSRSVCEQTGVVIAAERVQQDILHTLDPELQHRLDSDYDIQGVAYLIRWLRLLFLREFSFSQSMCVWTVLFAEMRVCQYRDRPFDLQLSLSLYLATAMLRFVREDLMVDSISALRRLMHYPPIEDIRALLCAACAASTNPLIQVYAKTPRHLPDIAGLDSVARSLVFGSFSASGVPAGTATLGERGWQECASSAAVMAAMSRQGGRLSTIIAKLERYWLTSVAPEPSEEAKRRATDELVQAIAELKKVRDVLMFGVDD